VGVFGASAPPRSTSLSAAPRDPARCIRRCASLASRPLSWSLPLPQRLSRSVGSASLVQRAPFVLLDACQSCLCAFEPVGSCIAGPWGLPFRASRSRSWFSFRARPQTASPPGWLAGGSPPSRFLAPTALATPGIHLHRVCLTRLRSVSRVSHPPDGFLPPMSCGLVSCRWRSWGSALQSFSLRTKS